MSRSVCALEAAREVPEDVAPAVRVADRLLLPSREELAVLLEQPRVGLPVLRLCFSSSAFSAFTIEARSGEASSSSARVISPGLMPSFFASGNDSSTG